MLPSVHCVVSGPWRLAGMLAAMCRYFLPLIAALGNVRLCNESWVLDFRLLHSRRWNNPIEVYLAKRHSQSLLA